MKTLLKVSFFVLGLIFILQCGEKDILPVGIYTPSDFKQQDFFLKEKYQNENSFSPGYLNGFLRSNQIILQWTEFQNPQFLCYKLFRSDQILITITNSQHTTYTDTGLVQDSWLEYRLATYNTSGISGVDTLLVKTPRFLPPSDLRHRVLPSEKIFLYWNNQAESATHFRIFQKKTGDPPGAFVEIGLSNDTFYVDSTIVFGESYDYQVSAFNNYENTNPSFSFTAIAEYIFNAPGLISVKQDPPARPATLHWSDNSTVEDGFKVYRKDPGDDFKLIAITPMNTLEYTDNDTVNSLQLYETYSYYITAYNQQGETAASQIIEVVITTGLPYIQVGHGILLDFSYPFHTAYDDARGQMLYFESEIQRQMTITALAFRFSIPPGQTMHHFNLRMKHTDTPFYSGEDFDNSGYVVCFEDSLIINQSGWIKIPLTNFFNYDGEKNLIVDISFDNQTSSSVGLCKSYYTEIDRNLIQRSRSLLGNPVFWSTGYPTTYIPIIRFYHGDSL